MTIMKNKNLKSDSHLHSKSSNSFQDKKKTSENELKDDFYDPPHYSRKFWILLFSFFFLMGLTLNFPLRSILEEKTALLIKQYAPCDLQYDDLDIEFFFFPKIILSKIKIPPECSNLTNDMVVNKAEFSFRGLGIYPFGPKMHLKGLLKKSQLDLNMVFSFKKMSLTIQDSTLLDSKDLMTLTESIPRMSGLFELEGNIDLNYKKQVETINLDIVSKDLMLPAQNFMNLDLPSLPISNFSLQLEQESKSVITVKELKLGNEKTPIYALFKGPMTLDSNAISFSQLDLQGEIKFSQEFLSSFPILKLIMKKYNESEGSYQVKLGGTLSSPIPSPL